MFKQALTAAALAALSACGGGGGGSGGGFMPIASAPAVEPKPAEPILQAPTPIYPNCIQVASNHIACDLISSEDLIGAAVPAGMFASFTNKTGTALQVIEVNAYTLERRFWSEYCAYLGDLSNIVTWQASAGKGEVGCATKQIGEDYAPVHFGNGLVVAPGEMFMLNAHTDPAPTNHTYTLRVQYLSNGGHSWRQPQVDQVIHCAGEEQATAMTPWRNDTGRDVQLSGASIYSETPSSRTPNTASGRACIYVLLEGGAQKYSNCDPALKTRGEVSFPAVTVAPGEYVAAQAANACSIGAHWNWASFLNVK